MSKQCPNCGEKIENQLETCPNCGYKFKEEDSVIADNNKNIESSSFINKELNENIEWSELKDMSLGHVMNLFNEQSDSPIPIEGNEAEGTKTDEMKLPIQENNITEEATEKTVILNNEEVKKTPEIMEEASEKENSGSPLYQYIKEHKNEEETASVTDDTNKKESNEPILEAPVTGSELILEDKTKTSSNETTLETKEQLSISDELTELSQLETTHSEKKSNIEVEAKKPIILSKSKKPEEIEMDTAPIFYKDPIDSKEKTSKPHINDYSKNNNLNNSQPEVNSKKSKKKLYLAAASVIILATGGWVIFDQVQKNSVAEKKIQTEQLEKKKALAASTKEALENYFIDDSHVFIKPGMISASTATIKKNLNQLKEEENYKELQAVYDLLTTKQTEISKVNALFAQPIINGNELKDVAILSDKKIEMKKVTERDALDKLVNQAIDEATKQYQQLQKAKELVAVIYKDNEVTDQLNLVNYNAAKTEVDKIKSEPIRKPLVGALSNANKVLVDAQQKEINAQESANASTNTTFSVENNASDTAQTSGAAVPEQNSTDFTPPNSNGVYTDPVYTVNPSDVADMSNPAWVWASGVKERVIATAIQRGYIVEGGYYLEPARIINGEGYYNLYGTSNQSALLSGFSEKDFPVYIVTINAKTGWFKGNASRNAGN